jgi:hypothetical protein
MLNARFWILSCVSVSPLLLTGAPAWLWNRGQVVAAA